jgi:hypothetical protein
MGKIDYLHVSKLTLKFYTERSEEYEQGAPSERALSQRAVACQLLQEVLD